jgi:putative endonuclease
MPKKQPLKKLSNKKAATKNSRSEFFVYMLECKDKTFYIGSTNNLEKRIHQHNHAKNGAHYTKIRRPVKLVYSKKCKTYAESRKREGELKRLSRKEKLEIIK